MAIQLHKKDNKLILEYATKDGSWILFYLKDEGEVRIKKVFTFAQEDRIIDSQADDNKFEFTLGTLEGEYFKIESNKLDIDYSLYIHKSIEVTLKFFIATRDISIFKKISKLVRENIYIGGDNVSSIPKAEFLRIIKEFPNTYELNKYADARVSSILKNYLETTEDSEKKFYRYMNRRASSREGEDIYQTLSPYEISKYQVILSKLEEMLVNEDLYTEKQWQQEMLQIILLLYPKYTYIFSETPISDGRSSRFIDYLLVDSGGNVDIVEIKKPFNNCIVTKNTYRDNYIPLRELSGTIMQIEKYILFLNRWGKKGEKKLLLKYRDNLPNDFDIHIINPSGLIIMGRDKGLSREQKQDFEVIRRKYKNVIDILTYDDLLKRLGFIIEQLTKGVEI